MTSRLRPNRLGAQRRTVLGVIHGWIGAEVGVSAHCEEGSLEARPFDYPLRPIVGEKESEVTCELDEATLEVKERIAEALLRHR
jgi:hypothetical protein